MLFVIFMQNFYKKFYNKKKRVIFTLSKIFDFSIKCEDESAKEDLFAFLS